MSTVGSSYKNSFSIPNSYYLFIAEKYIDTNTMMFSREKNYFIMMLFIIVQYD